MSATANGEAGRPEARDGARDGGRDEPPAARLRPTLFVGIGGTGKEVLLRLRRRILQHDWDGRRIGDLATFPVAQFLYFDTDTTGAVESDRSRRTDLLGGAVGFRENERLQKRVDVRRIMAEIDNHPLIGEWLPEADLSSINTEKGAGQVRAISRLLFFDQFATLQRRLRDGGDALLNSVGNQNELSRLNLEIEPELRIVVVCSAAGGTGSGAFIDAGLLARSMRNPRAAQVDLVLLLPGGFKGNNYQRVNANTFAALMELEHAMRPGAEPPYVERWTERDAPVPGIAPYDDVYLVDSRNVLMAGTDKVDQVYDMVADILFEDLGSSEFAARKRSIAPNQQQFKMVNYLPPLSPKVGERSLSWSAAFSSFGQATIDTKAQVALDTAVARAAKAMLKAYFNVALEDSGRLPTVEERDRFLFDEFALQPSPFEEALDGLDDRASINEPALVGVLLQNENGESVAANLALQVQRRFESGPFTDGDLLNLPTLVLREFEQRRDDVLGSMQRDATVGTAGAAVVANRQRLARLRRGSSEGGVREVLFRTLDNRARGGLDYTIRLVEDAKAEIEEAVAELDAVERRYADRADGTRARFEGSLENLKEAVTGRFILGPDRRAAARYLGHLRTEIIYFSTMLLRRQAAIEARTFLREMSAELGTRRGVDADGRTLWDGAIAELIQGRRLVEQTLGGFDGEIALLQDAVAREEAGTYLVLPDMDAEADALLATEPDEIERWAEEIFGDEGGSRTLFPILEDEPARTALLARLRAVAMREIVPRAARLRSVHDILLGMTPAERMRVFERAMVRAMPWLNAGFDHLGESMVMADRYKLLVAVEHRGRFAADFERELRQVVPTGRLGLHNFELVNSGLRNRIIVYCEVSGIPLDSIVPLRDDWRDSYRNELSAAFPLHNHRQASRFPSPVVPSAAEIETTRRVVGLFLRAACLGVLRRGEGRDAPWQLHVGGGDWIDVGTERDLRANGFASANHRQLVQAAVERLERELEPVQVLAAAVLLDWTARRAYAARKLRIGPNQTDRVPGLTHRVAIEAAAEYARRFANLPPAALPEGMGGDVEAARRVLEERLGEWTREIPDSLGDTDPADANRDPGERDEVRAVNKRRIVPERFAEEALRALLRTARTAAIRDGAAAASATAFATAATTGTTGVAGANAAGMNAAGAKRSWYLGIDRVVSGPFGLNELAGKLALLRPGTSVLELGTRRWVRLREVPALLALLDAPPPPPPDEDDIPPPPDDETSDEGSR